MTIARIDNGAVAEIRDLVLDDVPAHKRGAWRPVVEDKPDYNPLIEVRSGPEVIVEPDRIVKRWTVAARPADEIRSAIKGEAYRRIVARYPEWRQANMTARGVELQDIWRRNGAWSAAEQSEADILTAAWAWIKAVRTASDAIEAISPPPADFADDSRWPA